MENIIKPTITFIRMLLLLLGGFTLVSCGKVENLDEQLGVKIPNYSSTATPTPTVTPTPTPTASPTNGELVIVSGDFQTVPPNQILPEVLRVQYLEGGIPPTTSKMINFAIRSGGGSLSQPSIIDTDASGYSQIYYTAGPNPGVVKIRASSGSAYIDFTANIADQTGKVLTKISGDNQNAEIGTNVSSPLRVRVTELGSGVNAPGVVVRFEVISGNGKINTSLDSTDVTSDLNGLASVTFKTGLSAGANIIRATILGTATQQETFTETGFLSSTNVDVSKSLISLADSSIIANGTATTTITFQAKDTYSNNISATGKLVVFSSNDGTLLGGVADHGDGTYTQIIQAPSSVVAGGIIVHATLDGVAVTHTATLTTNPTPIPAGQTGLSVVSGDFQTVAPNQTLPNILKVQYLENGLPAIGKTVSFVVQNSGGGSFSNPSVMDTDSSGIAQVYYTVGPLPGTKTIRAISGSYFIDITVIVVDQSGKVLTKTSGDNQNSVVHTNLADPLRVRISNQTGGTSAAGVIVRFEVTGGNGKLNSSESSVNVVSDSNGYASAFFTTGTIAGSNTVQAIISEDPTQQTTFTSTGLAPPSSVNVTTSLVSTADNSIQANGSSTTMITLQSKDIYSNNVTASGQAVIFSVNGGTLIGNVLDNGDGTYSQLLRAPIAVISGGLVVHATFNGVQVTDTATITTIPGDIDRTMSTVTASSTSIIANGSSTTLITVTLKDSLGNTLITGGQNVVISSNAGTLLGTVSDHGNGTYTQILRSSTLARSVNISATVGGLNISNTGTVTFSPGPPDLSQSTVSSNYSTLQPDGVMTALITVLLRDMYGNSLTSSAGNVSLSLANTDIGTLVGTIRDNGDGSYQQVLRAPLTSGSAHISATIENVGVIADTATIYFTDGISGPSSTYSLVEVTGSSFLPADGISTTSIKVTVKDANNHQIATGGSHIVFLY